MPFLTDDDYELQIRTEIAASIGATGASRLQAELFAQSEMEGYINTRYNATAVFAATGADRSPIVIMYMIDIVIYICHSKVATRAIPKERSDRYEAAKTWLKMLAKGDLNPDLPVPETDPAGYLISTGSNCKRSRGW